MSKGTIRGSFRALAAWMLPAVLATLVAAACGGGSDATAVPAADTLEAATKPGPFVVGVATFELVDSSRPTQANGDFPGTDDRRMALEIWYPAAASTGEGRDAPVAAQDTPYPLIVFAHGLASSRVQSTTYTRHLASHGYVVAAPDFPLTKAGAPGGPRLLDLVNQPADVSFVIDSLLSFSETEGHPLEGAVDAERIGLTGHSLGGFTTLLAVYGPNRESRIDAALALSASGCYIDEGDTANVVVPIMLMTGSDDLIVPAPGNRRAYELAQPPRFWVELVGGGHVRFSDADVDDAVIAGFVDRLVGRDSAEAADAGSADSCEQGPPATRAIPLTLVRQQELLRAFATPFFDAYLRDSDRASRFLEDELPSITEDAARYEFETP
ncbi:MAG: dienelactone hydrolase family protein [Dehalococcoidia bacterium]